MTPDSSERLGQKTLRGISWMGGARVARHLLQFGIMVVLARLLSPEEFGLAVMIAVFTGFVGLFNEAGLGAALIQRKEIEERHRSSVFWLNLLLGGSLALLTYFLAPAVAAFYKEPELVPLTRLAAAGFIVAAFSTVHLATLRREMLFKRIAIIEFVSVAVGGVTAIAGAMAGYGATSLVWQPIAVMFVTAALLWIVGTWRPRNSLDWSAVGELLRFSGNLLGFRVFNYWIKNADNLLIGRFIGSAGLGVYSRAYSTMTLASEHPTLVAGQVMFPALSRIQNDIGRVREVFLRSNRLIGFFTIPALIGLFVVAEPLVATLFGPGWEEVVPVLEILAVVGARQSVVMGLNWLFMSQGRTDLQFRWGIVSGLLTVAAFAVGLRWGVVGVAWSYLAVAALLTVPQVVIAGSLIELSFGRWTKNLLGIVIASLVMMAATLGVAARLPHDLSAVARLAIEVATGVVVYLLAAHLGRLRAHRDIRQLLFRRTRKNDPA